MKTIVSCFFILFIFGCNSHQKSEKERKAERIANDEYIKSISKENISVRARASEHDLNNFLDSIYNLKDTQPNSNPMYFEDSIFHSRVNMSLLINDKDFEALKIGAKKGKLDISLATKIFRYPMDSAYISENYVRIIFFPFNRNNTFNEFAICIGGPAFDVENDVYFFKKNKVVAFHHIYHRYGLGIESFKDADNRTTIYYSENFGGGTGPSQFNFFFYKYFDNKLVPVLNIPYSSMRDVFDGLTYDLQSEILKTSPLTLHYFYTQELTDTTNTTVTLVNDSAIVQFLWDEKKLTYTSKYNPKFSYRNLMSYIDYDNPYIIKSYYRFFKTILAGKDTTKKNIVLIYLDNIRNGL